MIEHDRGPLWTRHTADGMRRRRIPWLTRLVIGAGVLLSCLLLAPAGQAQTQPVDVLFIFDTTGSMDGALSEAKAQATTLTHDISAAFPGAAFGVAEMRDYPDLYGDAIDVPWHLVSSVSTDPSVFATSVASLVAKGGGDGPEAYGRALNEARIDPAVGWRPGSRRLVVVLGDNMPHDNDLNEGIPADLRVSTGVWDTGIDPGRDGVVGTGDDVDLQQELAAMQRDGIQILHVYYHGDPATLAYWQQWARITGGEATLSTSGVLSETIVRLVREAATRPLPACPFGTARSSDNICQPVRAVVFVSGLGSSQKFADSNTLASCPDAGTWQHVAQQIRARHGKNYQVFLAPVDRASGSSGNCPGVRRAAEPVMRIQSMKDTNIDDNGRALSVFLGNLKARYGVTDVVIVGHSFGGLWARSALTRQSKGAQVRILDIITVGTPHEGSYAADVREKVRDICTNFGDKRMRAVACTADGLIAAGFGKTSSLTGSYVSGWNRSQSRQTPWGCVPVRGIAGKAFTWPLPTTTSYMSPHDGVVGIGSALPSEAAVPGFQSLGSYEHLVHTAAFLASLSGGESMTKAPVVTEAISDLLPSGPELLLGSCSTKQTTFSRGEHRTNATDGGVRVDQAKKKPAKPKVRRVAVAFSVTWKKGAGNALTAKRAETNAYVLTGKSSLRCGKLRVDGVPLFGVSEVRYVPAAACKGKIRVVGATKKTGAIPVAKSKGKLTLVATSKGVAIRASGIPGGKVQVSFSRRGAKTLRKWVAAGRTTAVRLPKGRYDVTAVAVRPKARYSVRTSWTRNSAG